jgi:methyl-accepting chemotaxis protein
MTQLVETLEQHSTNISGIVNVIRDIADQTNLLALNAAIEAARAGEQGRGFAVVADEVRKLAERTGGATTEIGQMIDAIQTETRNAVAGMEQSQNQVGTGVQLAGQAADSLVHIQAETRRTLDQINDIASASQEQSAAANEIAQNVERIASMSEENSVAIRDASETATRLSELAHRLDRLMNRFKV